MGFESEKFGQNKLFLQQKPSLEKRWLKMFIKQILLKKWAENVCPKYL